MKMKDDDIKRLAVQLTYNCVRNTVIEDSHAAGKLTNAEIKAFNKEVSNKLYTALRLLFGKKVAKQHRNHLLKHWDITYPREWDEPQNDEDIEATVLLSAMLWGK